MFKTKITEMFDIKYPIVEGAMMWIMTSEFTAAVANAGGLGVLTSAIYQNRAEFVGPLTVYTILRINPLL